MPRERIQLDRDTVTDEERVTEGVEQQFSADAMVAGYEDIYRQVLAL